MRGLWPYLLALGIGLVANSIATAGWVVIKNETKQALVVVEVAGTPNRPIQGKPVKIQPGETHREFHPGAGQKTFAIYDAAKLDAPLAQQAIFWRNEDTAFGIRLEGKGYKLDVAKK